MKCVLYTVNYVLHDNILNVFKCILRIIRMLFLQEDNI